MAGGIARAAGGGGGGNSNLNLEGFTGTKTGFAGMVERMKYSIDQKAAAGQGGIDDGSTAGVAPAPITGAPVDAGGTDQFAGKKFEISPVQMKGSFSSKTRENAEGVYGDEDERNNSLKR